MWGDIPFLGEGLPTQELLSRVQDAEAFAELAHVGRRDVWRMVEPEWLHRLGGVELWNRKYDGYAPNEHAASLLRQRCDLVPFVSLDFHTARQLHPLAMVLELNGDLSEAHVLDALQSRRAGPSAFGFRRCGWPTEWRGPPFGASSELANASPPCWRPLSVGSAASFRCRARLVPGRVR